MHDKGLRSVCVQMVTGTSFLPSGNANPFFPRPFCRKVQRVIAQQQNPKVSFSLCLSPITHGKQQQLKPHSRIIKCLFSIEGREGRAKNRLAREETNMQNQ